MRVPAAQQIISWKECRKIGKTGKIEKSPPPLPPKTNKIAKGGKTGKPERYPLFPPVLANLSMFFFEGGVFSFFFFFNRFFQISFGELCSSTEIVSENRKIEKTKKTSKSTSIKSLNLEGKIENAWASHTCPFSLAMFYLLFFDFIDFHCFPYFPAVFSEKNLLGRNDPHRNPLTHLSYF